MILWYNNTMMNNMKTEETVTITKAEYESLKQQVTWLMAQLKLSKHRQFGVSSEKTEYDNCSLFNETEVNASEKVAEPDIEEVKAYKRKKSGKSSDRLPPDLPVEIIEHELPPEERLYPECGQEMHVMGREVREELKLIPAQAIITRHVGHVYACRNCEKNAEQVPFVKAPLSEPVIKGSFASPEAIAHIAAQKFAMGIPLYRQEQEWQRSGILLSRQTMSNWLLKATSDWLGPVYGRLHELLCAAGVGHADETTLQVLHEPGKPAQGKSYMWLYRTSGNAKHHIVLYDYQPSRAGKHPAAFLKDFQGFLHTDGYDAYHKGLPGGITVIGCWAHCRRKFDEALKIIPERERAGTGALHGKHFCDRLFSWEREFEALPPGDNFKARYEARLKQSRPLMDDFFAWAEKTNAVTLPQSPLGKALKYALDQKKWLKNVLLDGRLELSNNRAERSIKPFVIGRKNWLFNNTPKGAAASAILYSLIETAKENGLNPYSYLTYVFKTAPNLPPGHSIDILLPWHMSPQV
jgi:transposase